MRRMLVVVGVAVALTVAAGCGSADETGGGPEDRDSAAPTEEVAAGEGAMSNERFCAEVLPEQLASLNQGATASLNELAEAAAGDEATRSVAIDEFRDQGGALGDGFRDAAEAVTDPELGAALERTADAVGSFVAEVAELATEGTQVAELDPMALDSSEELVATSSEVAAFCEE